MTMCLSAGCRLPLLVQIYALLAVVVCTVRSQALDSVENPVLQYTRAEPDWQVSPKGTELRILCVGDSITTGFLSNLDGGDGNGYRYQLEQDLHKNKVVFAGMDKDGEMKDGYFAAWRGKTIQYISDHVDSGLEQRPNLILVHAGTNDMNPNPALSLQGTDDHGAADRLGKLIDKLIDKCPDATILVAIIINTCVPKQEENTKKYQALIPGVVQRRADEGHHVLAVNFTSFGTDLLRDCIHPTNDGYKVFGDYWYDFITQIPQNWIKKPVGKDPKHSGDAGPGASASGTSASGASASGDPGSEDSGSWASKPPLAWTVMIGTAAVAALAGLNMHMGLYL